MRQLLVQLGVAQTLLHQYHRNLVLIRGSRLMHRAHSHISKDVSQSVEQSFAYTTMQLSE